MMGVFKTVGLLILTVWAAVATASSDYLLHDLDGKAHKLSDYQGKWVIINYWATWCPPCREEIPELILFHEKHKDHDAVVLGVNMQDVAVGELRQFIDDNFISYPIFAGSPQMDTVGPVPGLPTTYLIAPDGHLAARQVGGVTAKTIEDFISKQ